MDLQTLQDDGLDTAEIGSWGITKHKLVALYASVFIRSMRRKWKSLVYLDLYSGSGRSKIRGTNRIVPASPLVVLGLEDKFSMYIFCEKDIEKYQTLDLRIKREYSDLKVNLINGDANTEIDRILGIIPQHTKKAGVLSFCFIDSCSLGNLDFSLLKSLSRKKMDFLILIPSGMDATRNMEKYLTAESIKLDGFLGRTDWRKSWNKHELRGKSFESFVVIEFGKSMEQIGFINPGLESSVPIYSDDKKLLLYRLMMYSRNQLGNRFWNEIKKSIDPQLKLKFPAA